ncbi:hypothetical protein L218DRAFT_458972 [Marasmius fiardii PR-910]|nr:hypothetical protein L218DRAFT_458972 [Marasmius fiardii PR-910]
MADNDTPRDPGDSSKSSTSDSRRKPTASKFKIELKWSKNAAEHTITALKTMEKAAGAFPIPGLAAIFFLTSEIIRSVDDTKENKKGFKLLAGEANALAHTLWEECAEIQVDERRAPLWQNLEPHINKFTDILENIRDLMERKHGRNFFVSFGNSKKDAGFIQELHNELKAAVDRFNVAMQVANRTALDRIEESQSASGKVLNRIETLLLKMQEAGHELESTDTNPESLPPIPVNLSNTEPHVVRPSSGSQDRTSTLESTSSNIPARNIDLVTPTHQVLSPLQKAGSTSSSAPSQEGDQVLRDQCSQPVPSRAFDPKASLLSQETRYSSSGTLYSRDQGYGKEFEEEQSVSSMPGFSEYRTESPIPISRAESSASSVPSRRENSTNPFWKLASIPDPGRTAKPAFPTNATRAPDLFSSPASDTPNPFMSMFNPASPGVSIAGSVTVNNVVGGQSITTDNSTKHSVNTGNTYNTTTINSNNRYDRSMDPSFYSYGPTYNLHQEWVPPPPNHYYHQPPPPRPRHHEPQWSPSHDHYHPPWQPPSSYPGRRGPY